MKRSEKANEIIQAIIKADKQKGPFSQHWLNISIDDSTALIDWVTSLEAPKWR
jgi:hypothetical protein